MHLHDVQLLELSVVHLHIASLYGNLLRYFAFEAEFHGCWEPMKHPGFHLLLMKNQAFAENAWRRVLFGNGFKRLTS